MNDLEICKRIAEIEGFAVELTRKKGYGFVLEYNGSHFRKYNPLRDDDICFKLSKKYNVSIMHYEEHSTARIWDDPEDNPIADVSDINNDTSLNKAILLAIIEAHKS